MRYVSGIEAQTRSLTIFEQKTAIHERWLRSIGLGLILTALLLGTSAASAQSNLEPPITQLITKHRLESALIGFKVEDARTGEVLARRNSDRALIPASNMKLLTTGSALAVLGPEFRFRTTIHLNEGVLTIVGSGDPALGDPDVLAASTPPLNVESLFERLAQAATSSQTVPVTRVRVDDRIFDRELVHPSWSPSNLTHHYAAPVSGLNVHTNNLAVFVAPGSATGSAPTVTTQPRSPWIQIVNEGRTDTSASNNTAWLSRSPTANNYRLHGTVVRRDSWPIRSPLYEPSIYAGQLMAHAIDQQATPPRRNLVNAVSQVEVNDTSDPGPVVAVVTTPLNEIILRCNRDSQNLYAEALLKRIGKEITGRPGSWKDGATVVRMLIAERLGPQHAATTAVSDGSGLSRDNLISADTLNAWIRNFHNDQALREPLFSSLATPGEGTFTRRFQGQNLANRVRGKSGTLNGVRTLSGTITHPVTGRALVYTFFVNQGQTGSVGVNARDFADEAVGVIDRWLTQAESAAALGG